MNWEDILKDDVSAAWYENELAKRDSKIIDYKHFIKYIKNMLDEGQSPKSILNFIKTTEGEMK